MSNRFIKEDGDTKKPTSNLSSHDEKTDNSSSKSKPNKESFPDEKPDHSRYPGQKETETKTQGHELKNLDDKIANNQKTVSKPDNEK